MSKKLITALAIALMMFAGASQAAITDIAVNGDFETGDFTGWTQFPGSLGAAGQTIVAGNPGSAARLNEPNPAANIIKQANLRPGEWTAGEQIEIKFQIRGSAAAGGVFFAEVFTELSGGGTSKSEILSGGPLFPNADPNVWTDYTFTTTVGPDSSGGMTLQLNAACGADANCVSDYYVDNVIINADIEVTPPPPDTSGPATSIPTTSQWALITLTMLLGLVVFANRRRIF